LRRPPTRWTILVMAGVVVATYLGGQLMYRLRDIVLLMLVAGFAAMLLNPAVAKVQRRVPRRGPAVAIVTLWAALVFIGLAAAFGVPLVNGITHLADRMPGYIASAQHGNGWIGHLVARYHVQSIVTAVVFAVYTQIENHVLNPVVMSKTVRISPLLVFIAVLAGASLGSLIGGFVVAVLAIPAVGALQVLVKEAWQATAPDQAPGIPGACG
jgi:predicted PurR-regulated permease PerM